MQAYTKVGLDALLTPDNCVVVMIDHQPFQLANVNSHEPTMVINNAIGLAMTAKAVRHPYDPDNSERREWRPDFQRRSGHLPRP
jgi:hypothetical protein